MKFRLMGITDLSTVDWPGKLSAVIFFQGCNFRCPWCQNVSGIDPKSGKEVDTSEVIEHIEGLKPIVDTVVITGGEPLFQPDASLELLKDVKKLDFRCAIETNGSNPHALECLLPYLDFIAIDVKAPLNDPEFYARVTGQTRSTGLTSRIKESLELAIGSGIETEARTTVVPTLNDDRKTIAQIAKEVKKVGCLCIQQFRNQRTFDENFQKLPMPSRDHLLELAQTAKQSGVKRVKIFTIERGLETI